MAASFYARTKGDVGVCLVTTGAGSTNAITGVMAAYMDSTPLIVISGNETYASLTGKTRVLGVQGYNSVRVAASFSDALRVGDSTELDDVLARAFHSATSSRCGPAWIDIPRDVQVANV